jgi:hypothetical protein
MLERDNVPNTRKELQRMGYDPENDPRLSFENVARDTADEHVEFISMYAKTAEEARQRWERFLEIQREVYEAQDWDAEINNDVDFTAAMRKQLEGFRQPTPPRAPSIPLRPGTKLPSLSDLAQGNRPPSAEEIERRRNMPKRNPFLRRPDDENSAEE